MKLDNRSIQKKKYPVASADKKNGIPGEKESLDKTETAGEENNERGRVILKNNNPHTTEDNILNYLIINKN